MMISPSVDEVLNARNIKNRYSLVIITAKRAREIQETGVTFTTCGSNKAVSVALNEIHENKVTFKQHSDEKPAGDFFVFKDDVTEE